MKPSDNPAVPMRDSKGSQAALAGARCGCYAEAMKRFGQAPCRSLFFHGFRRLCSKPVPFFHSLEVWGWLLLSMLAVSNAFASETIQVVAQQGKVTVRRGDQTLMVYQSEPNPYKVYVHSLMTPAGRQILRDSPGDHVHHRSLMYAIGVDGVDFWHEAPSARPGSQIPIGSLTTRSASSNGRWQASIRQDIDWKDFDGQVLLRETRRLNLDGGTLPDATLLVWDSQFRTPEGRDQVELWGQHYFGLGLRMIPSMDQGAKVLRSTEDDAREVRGTERLWTGPWCGLTAMADGHPVTVAMFDHPENVPATWFTMTGPFAYLSATLGWDDEKKTLTADAPLRLRYAVVLWDGEKSPAEIADAYSRWIEQQ